MREGGWEVMESRVRDEWAVLSGSALAHVLWLPNGYCTMNQTGTQTQTLLRHKNIVKTWKKFSVSIHYELLLFFFAREGLSFIVTGRFNLVHCPLSSFKGDCLWYKPTLMPSLKTTPFCILFVMPQAWLKIS